MEMNTYDIHTMFGKNQQADEQTNRLGKNAHKR